MSMRRLCCFLVMGVVLAGLTAPAQAPQEGYLSPARPVPTGKAPGMQIKAVKQAADEQVYAITFPRGDEALSGLTDFAISHKIQDAHFTAIGAVNSAILAWLDQDKRMYRVIPVSAQVEVVSLTGDIATFEGKPIVHMHCVLSRPDGTTLGGHVFELHVNPTLEVFLTANATPLNKKPDPASGMKVIDPTQ